jgi:hypothetical protein
MWIGRPLLGQWVWDVRRTLDVLEATDGKLSKRVALVGQGPAGVVALCTTALDRRVTEVVAIDSLASYVSAAPYKGQRLGIMAPGMLRELGDIAHLAALCLPRRVVLAGGVLGDGAMLDAAGRRQAYAATQHVDKLQAAPSLRLIEADSAGIVEALRD